MSNFPPQTKTPVNVMDYSTRVSELLRLHRARTQKEESPNRLVVAAKFIGKPDDLLYMPGRRVFTSLDHLDFAAGGWLPCRKQMGRVSFYFTRTVRLEHPFDANGAPVIEVELYDDVDTEFNDQYLADCVRLAGFYDAIMNNHPTWKNLVKTPGNNCPAGPCWISREQWLRSSINLWYTVDAIQQRSIFNFLFPNPADPDTYHSSVLRYLEETLPNGLFFDSKYEGMVTFAGNWRECGDISRVRIRTKSGDQVIDGPPNSRIRVRPGDFVKPGMTLFQILPAAKSPDRCKDARETVKAILSLYPANSAADCVEAWFDGLVFSENSMRVMPAWAVSAWLDAGNTLEEGACVAEVSDFLRLANSSGATRGWTVLPPVRVHAEMRRPFHSLVGGLNLRINRMSETHEAAEEVQTQIAAS